MPCKKSCLYGRPWARGSMATSMSKGNNYTNLVSVHPCYVSISCERLTALIEMLTHAAFLSFWSFWSLVPNWTRNACKEKHIKCSESLSAYHERITCKLGEPEAWKDSSAGVKNILLGRWVLEQGPL